MRHLNHTFFAAVIFGLVFSGIFAPPVSFAQENIAPNTQTEETQPLSKEDAQAIERWKEVVQLFRTRYWREVSTKELMDKMIQGGLTSFDPHTSIQSPEEWAEENIRIEGSFGGLGIEIQKNKNGASGILVISPIDDTPAARAGIQSGDVITKINGTSTQNMTLQKAVSLMRGRPDTQVTITVFREGAEKPLVMTLTRAVIQIQYVKHELKEGGVGYVRISSFGGETVPDLVKDAVRKLKEKNGGKKLSGLVLDLQNNPGGLLDAALGVHDLFLNGWSYYSAVRFSDGPAAVVVLSHEARGKISSNRSYIGTSGDITDGIPLLVLINNGSASASEIVAKTLQVFGRATVAGISKSFGKGTVQTLFELDTGGVLRLTTSQYLVGPKGCEQAIQNEGVTPGIWLKPQEEESAVAERTEAELPDSIARSVISNANCAYRYTLPEGHREAAYEMLKVMGLSVLEKETTE